MSEVEATEVEAKADQSPLTIRATPPKATRLRGAAVRGGVGLAALVGAGAFVYAFVLAPQLKAHAAAQRPAVADKSSGQVRPNEKITGHPAGYEQMAGDGANAGTVLTTRAEAAGSAGASSSSPSAGGIAGTSSGTAVPVPPSVPSPPNPAREAAKLARTSDLFFAKAERRGPGPGDVDRLTVTPVSDASNGAPSTQARADYDQSYGRHVLIAPRSPFELKAGTMVTAALDTAVDTGRPGPVVAITTAPLFDTVTGRTLLVPQGSRLIGQETGDNAYGESRAFVIWKRLILPNGKSLLLEDQAGTDATGAAGVPGRVDHRWFQLGGAIVASGAITTLGELARGNDNRQSRSLVGTVGDATAVEAANVGGRLIDRELHVQPKVRVPAGAPVQVLLTKDLVLEPYAA